MAHHVAQSKEETFTVVLYRTNVSSGVFQGPLKHWVPKAMTAPMAPIFPAAATFFPKLLPVLPENFENALQTADLGFLFAF